MQIYYFEVKAHLKETYFFNSLDMVFLVLQEIILFQTVIRDMNLGALV